MWKSRNAIFSKGDGTYQLKHIEFAPWKYKTLTFFFFTRFNFITIFNGKREGHKRSKVIFSKCGISIKWDFLDSRPLYILLYQLVKIWQKRNLTMLSFYLILQPPTSIVFCIKAWQVILKLTISSIFIFLFFLKWWILLMDEEGLHPFEERNHKRLDKVNKNISQGT